MIHKFTIDAQLPSLNNYIEACRRNAYSGGSFKRQTDKLCATYIRIARLQPIKNPVTIEFEWHEKTQRRDLDNVSGYGHKTILDALVNCGILKDDSPKYVCGLSDSFVRDRKNFVVVTITEIEQQQPQPKRGRKEKEAP